MFKIKPVKGCPYTKGNGLIHMPPWLIAELAGAVKDRDEWAIVFKGQRLEGGKLVVIEDYFIPPQTRTGGSVTIGEVVMTPDIVGVAHSHHKMGAFFSATDDTQLNPRFPISIVVADKKNFYLGFDYKAEGKFTLPCGSQGQMKFLIQPAELDENGVSRPVGPVLASVESDPVGNDLSDCNQFTELEGDQYQAGWLGKCGIKQEGLRVAAFGVGDTLAGFVDILPRFVPPPQTRLTEYNLKGLGKRIKKLYRVTDNRRAFLKNSTKGADQPITSLFEDENLCPHGRRFYCEKGCVLKDNDPTNPNDPSFGYTGDFEGSVYSADERAADEWLEKRAKKDARREKLRRKAKGLEDPQDVYGADKDVFSYGWTQTEYERYLARQVGIDDAEELVTESTDSHGYSADEYWKGWID